MSKVRYWLTGLTSAICLFSLWNLYQTKQQAKLIQYHITQVQKEMLAANEHTARLKMEWGILNQPERLEDLSKRFLPSLRPTETVQFAQLDQASSRLPETYSKIKSDHPTMLADNRHDNVTSSNVQAENISLAHNNIAPLPASVVSHAEDGGLESAINDLEKNDTQKHIRSLPVAQASPHSLDDSYDKLLTAFQQSPSAQMPSEL
ncbi:hypothetical protein FAI41_00675 [Acetobacteraceae bacterium]|nr:hypothetical protein FAI41_00675 [Acetobacteraceae bacterium]